MDERLEKIVVATFLKAAAPSLRFATKPISQ
jgi:hypothetical protein